MDIPEHLNNTTEINIVEEKKAEPEEQSMEDFEKEASIVRELEEFCVDPETDIV